MADAERALRLRDVTEVTSLSRATIERLIREGSFPQARRMGGVVFWLASEVTAWIRACPVRTAQ